VFRVCRCVAVFVGLGDFMVEFTFFVVICNA
jgi:hypothetical protein